MANLTLIRSKLNARSSRILILVVMVTHLALAQSSQKPAAQAPEKKAAPGATEIKTSEPPGLLIQLNGALESLAAKVSPAVVQILVTGYGPLREREDDRSQAAF